jgi:hypothetical protein
MPDENKATYDFEFIARSLGLWLIKGGAAAINPSAILAIDQTPDGAQVVMRDYREYSLSAEEMAEWESQIKSVARAIQQFNAMQRGVIVGDGPPGRRFRQ